MKVRTAEEEARMNALLEGKMDKLEFITVIMLDMLDELKEIKAILADDADVWKEEKG